MVEQAAVEYLKAEYGKKKTAMPEAFKDELSKACSCSTSMAAGCHKETCTFYPFHLKASLCRHIEKRRTIEAQLKKTTLTAMQRDAALDPIFGPSDVVAKLELVIICGIIASRSLASRSLASKSLASRSLASKSLVSRSLASRRLSAPPLLLGRGGGGII